MQNSEAENPNPSPPWLELPADVTADILRRLDTEEILETAQKVCTYWWRVCKDPSIWRVIEIRLSGLRFPHHNPYSTEIMCRKAVDLSQGQLIDITIKNFGTKELLLYIGQRCNLLKCLKLEKCNISGKGLTAALKNFPYLEELHLLFFTEHVTAEDIESIGTSCPNLKSFTYDNSVFRYVIWEILDGLDVDDDDNANALAVAKSMPNLCNLALLSDNMNNEGLEAILNSCMHLKSLDIQDCLNVDLSGDLGRRCSYQLQFLIPLRYASDDHDLYDHSDDCRIDEHYLYNDCGSDDHEDCGSDNYYYDSDSGMVCSL